mgnify:CR=1 FL=1
MGKKRILICGASGFIGRNLFEYFSKRKDLEVIGTYHRRKFGNLNNLIQADLTKKPEVEKILKGVDILIQAAATTSGSKDIVEKPYLHVTDNVVMNAYLFQAAYEHNVSQVIFFSCTVMYPILNRPIKESDLKLDNGIYQKYFGVGWTKVYLEKLCEFYSRLGKTKFTVVRHSNIYGPYDKFDLLKSHVFGATVTKVMTNKSGRIIVWGEGKEERDLLYVSDLVNFVNLVIDKQDYSFDIFNASLGKSISVKDLVSKIIKASGKKLIVKFDRTKPTIATKLVLNINKAKRKFGWSPKISLDEGINKTLSWYRENVKD